MEHYHIEGQQHTADEVRYKGVNVVVMENSRSLRCICRLRDPNFILCRVLDLAKPGSNPIKHIGTFGLNMN